MTFLLLLLGVSFLVSALGFIRFLWFISVGYGYAIATMALLSFVLLFPDLTGALSLHLALLLLYGLRLGTFVLFRQMRTAYGQKLSAHRKDAKIALPKKLKLWVSVSLLYFLLFSPGAFHSLQPFGNSLFFWFAATLSALGLGLEAVADAQKSHYKTATG